MNPLCSDLWGRGGNLRGWMYIYVEREREGWAFRIDTLFIINNILCMMYGVLSQRLNFPVQCKKSAAQTNDLQHLLFTIENRYLYISNSVHSIKTTSRQGEERRKGAGIKQGQGSLMERRHKGCLQTQFKIFVLYI